MGNGTSIGRVRGLGSAKEGGQHWWRQRVTAGGNILLVTWLVISLARMPGFDYQTVRLWLASPWVAIPMLMLVGNTFYHFRLGLQVVIEDYQHDAARVVMLVLLNAFTLGTAAIAIFSILKVAFTGAQS